MDIGTLTGAVEIEDQMSHALDQIANKVKTFASEFDGIMGKLVVGTGAVVAGITAITGAITALGVRGSEVNDVSETLNRFAGSAENAADIMNKLRDGTKGIVTDFDLMKNASKLLAAGVKVTADDFKTLGEGARLLANQGLGSVKDMMGTVSQAMLTGRTRTLEMYVGKLNLKKVEEDYARTLGTTRNDLTQLEKTEASRVGILELLRQKLKQTGEQQLSFGDMITRSVSAVKNFFDQLSSAVAASPTVMQAMRDIQFALAEAFGGTQEELIKNIVKGINQFALAASTVAQYASAMVVKIREAVEWYQALPQPVRDTVVLLAEVATAVVAINYAFGILAGSAAVDTALAAFAYIAEWGALIGTYGVEAIIGMWTEALMAAEAAMASFASALVVPALVAALTYGIVQLGYAFKGLYDAMAAGDGLWDSLKKAWEFLSKREANFISRNLLAERFVPKEDLEAKPIVSSRVAMPLAGSVSAVSPVNPALAEEQERVGKLAEQTKEQAAELYRTYTQGSRSLDAVSMATNQLSAAQRQNYDILRQAAPAVMQLADAGRTLSAGQRELVNNYIARTEAISQTQMKELSAKGVTLESIEANNKVGISLLKEMSFMYGVTEKSMGLYIEQLKKQLEATQGLQSFEAAYRDQQLKDSKRQQDQASEVNKAIAVMDEEYQTKRTDKYKTATQIRMDAITKESNARTAALMLGKTEVQQAQIMAAAARNLAQALDEVYDEEMLSQWVIFNNLETQATISMKEMNRAAKTAAIDGLADFFRALGDISGGLGPFMNAIGSIMTSFKSINDLQNTVSERTGKEVSFKFGLLSAVFDKNTTSAEKWTAGIQAATMIAQGAKEVWDATAKSATTMGNAMGGAMAGAQAGAVAGPWGIAAGAAAGLVVGLIRGKPDWAKAATEIARDFGTKISDELAKAIDESAKKDFGGSRQAAGIFNLDKIIGEAGGVSEANVGQFTDRLRDVFSMVQTGAFTTAQAVEVLDKNFGALLEGNTDKLGYWSDSIKEIIALNQQMGIESNAIRAAMSQQAGILAGSFNAIMAGTASSRKEYSGLKKAVDEATKSYKDLTKEHDNSTAANSRAVSEAEKALAYAQKHPGIDKAKSLQAVKDAQNELNHALGAQARTEADIAKAHDKLTEALTKQHAAAEAAKEELKDLGTIAVATFAAAYEATGDLYAALEAGGAGLKDLQQAYEDLGMEAEDPFLKMLFVQSQVMENAPELIKGVQGLGSALVAMSNLNMLNAESFQSVADTAARSYARIQGEVAKAGGTTKDALLPMQNYLHAAVKAAEELGVPLDEITQQMIDQSKELGIWKDKGPSAQEKMITATDRLTSSIDRLAAAFGLIPTSIPDPFEDWNIPDTTGVGGGTGGGGEGGGEAPGFDVGGVAGQSQRAPSSRDVIPAWLRKGEVVFTPEQAAAIATPAPAPAPAAASAATAGPTSITFGDVQFVVDKDTDAAAMWEAFITELRMNPNTRGKLQVLVTGNRKDTHY